MVAIIPKGVYNMKNRHVIIKKNGSVKYFV